MIPYVRIRHAICRAAANGCVWGKLNRYMERFSLPKTYAAIRSRTTKSHAVSGHNYGITLVRLYAFPFLGLDTHHTLCPSVSGTHLLVCNFMSIICMPQCCPAGMFIYIRSHSPNRMPYPDIIMESPSSVYMLFHF